MQCCAERGAAAVTEEVVQRSGLQREEVLAWLTSSAEEDVDWVLSNYEASVQERVGKASVHERLGKPTSGRTSRKKHRTRSVKLIPPQTLAVKMADAACKCDGIYELVPESTVNDYPFWKQQGAEHWLYSSPDRVWHVGGLEAKQANFDGSRGSLICCSLQHADAPPCQFPGGWMLPDGSSWRRDAGVHVRDVATKGKSKAFLEKMRTDGQIVSQESWDHCCKSTFVHFASGVFMSMESVPKVSIAVIRAGNLSVTSEVRFSTRDKTALAGKHYKVTTGALTFEPGELVKHIEVELFQDETWGATADFLIYLSEDGLKDAELYTPLASARVRLINDDLFPTSKYEAFVKEERSEDIPAWGLLFEYFRMNFASPTVRVGTIKMVLADFVHNLYFLLQLFLDVWLIDHIMQYNGTSEALSALLIVCAGRMGPLVVLHALDYRKTFWKVGGSSRMTLQSALYRKYLRFDPSEYAKFGSGEIETAISRDSKNVVKDGYLTFVGLPRLLGQLAMMLLFQLLSPVVFLGDSADPFVVLLGVFPLVFFPIFLGTFLRFRSAKMVKVLTMETSAENVLVEGIQQVMMSHHLIADYAKQSWAIDSFQDRVKDNNQALVNSARAILNNTYFAKWLTMLFLCAYTLIGGLQVVQGERSLGLFMAGLRIFTKIGGAWTDIYLSFLKMQTVLADLQRIERFLNMPNATLMRMPHVKYRIARTLELSETIQPDADVPHVDLLPIELKDFSTVARRRSSQVMKIGQELVTPFDHPVKYRGELRIAQGQLTCFVGPASGGKGTLLKTLGSITYPSETDGCFVPSHLKVVHLSAGEQLLAGTLRDNLVFGLANKNGPEASPERVDAICRRLGITDRVLTFIEHEADLNWQELLSDSEKRTLGLARALIASPEVLIVHKVGMMLTDPEAQSKVWQALRDFVDQRGLAEDPDTFGERRPRTCLVSCRREDGLAYGDQVFSVENGLIRSVDLGDSKDPSD